MNIATFPTNLWAETLLRACGQGTLALLGVWAVCRLLPRLPGSLRCALWWLACLKLLAGLVCIVPVRLALLPPPRAVAPTSPPQAAVAAFPTFPSAVGAPLSGMPARTQAPAPAAPWRHALPLCLLLSWLVGVAIRLAALGQGWRRVRGWLGQSQVLSAPEIERAARDVARRLGLRRAPRVCVSEAACPLAVGGLRPTVLLPRALCDAPDTLPARLALAHEMAHLRRGDLWLAWVPALANALFFFHPLVWLAGREYLQAREEACDAAALRLTGAPPDEYGRLLLRFGVADAPPMALAASGTAPSFQALRRRLLMLRDIDARPRRGVQVAAGLALALVAGSLVPLRVVAQKAKVTPAPRAVVMAQAPANAVRESGDATSDDTPQVVIREVTPDEPAAVAKPPQKSARKARRASNHSRRLTHADTSASDVPQAPDVPVAPPAPRPAPAAPPAPAVAPLAAVPPVPAAPFDDGTWSPVEQRREQAQQRRDLALAQAEQRRGQADWQRELARTRAEQQREFAAGQREWAAQVREQATQVREQLRLHPPTVDAEAIQRSVQESLRSLPHDLTLKDCPVGGVWLSGGDHVTIDADGEHIHIHDKNHHVTVDGTKIIVEDEHGKRIVIEGDKDAVGK